MAHPAQTPKMEKVSAEARAYVLGLIARGLGSRNIRKRARREFPREDWPAEKNLLEWYQRPEIEAEVEAVREKIREKATERSFADVRQQIDALVTNAERLFGLFSDTPDKEVLALIRLNGEIRETFKAIRDATAPFQTSMPDVLSSFERFQEAYAAHLAARPEEVRERLKN